MDSVSAARELFLRALDAQAQGDLVGAEQLMRNALALQPERVSILVNLSALLIEANRHAEGREFAASACRLGPDVAHAWLNQGICLRAADQPDEALVSFKRALELQPDLYPALIEAGGLLLDCFELSAALKCFERALAISPDSAEAHHNCGLALARLGEHDQAIKQYEHALSLNPASHISRFNRGLSRLSLGDYVGGLEDYESRWQSGMPRHGYELWPFWQGEPSLNGKIILIHAEQGFGDSLQFCRYIPELHKRGARVWLGVPEPLRELFGGLEGVERVSSVHEDFHGFDFHCPMASLPRAFGATPENIPQNIPYLHARRQPGFLSAPPATKTLRIGLAWSGSGAADNPLRRLSLAQLEPVWTQDCDFISLQTDYQEEDKSLLGMPQLQDFSEQLKNFADTAALIGQLDLVISIDTAVAHLAAAMGKPLWLMLPAVSDWRWGRGERCDWYPAARMFRQSQLADWTFVISEVSKALSALRTGDCFNS